ncbi:MAG: glycosyltransferase [Paludibacter sp.]|nr:glycosyltransferase [Paludibacter sp.]
MKNILNVVSVFFSIPFFFGDQFMYFKRKGYNIHLICSPSEYLDEYANKQNVKYKEIAVNRSISPIMDLLGIIKICNYIKKNKIDIVVGHSPKGALLSMTAAKIMCVPVRIYFRHGLVYTTQTGWFRKLLIYEERLVSMFATKIVCVSPSLSQFSIEEKLNPESKQIMLGKGTCGGIDTVDKFNPERINIREKEKLRKENGIPEEAFVVGYSGRLVQDKGITELVNGFELLQTKYPQKPLFLLLVGTFEERDALPELIVDKITKNISILYTGYIKNNIELYYSLMSMLILPSYREGFPISVIEASAMCLPVLTTRSIGCVDSIIEGITGYYVDINPESICCGIERYFDPELREKLGLAGRDFVVNNFDNMILWDEIEKLYE